MAFAPSQPGAVGPRATSPERRGPRHRVVFPLFLGLVAWQPQTARVITRCNLKSNGYPAHHPPLPGTINPVCATREHVRPPALQAPLVRKSQTLQGGKRSWLG